MIIIHAIDREPYKIVFHASSTEVDVIDRFSLSSVIESISPGFVEVLMADQLMYKGLYRWFAEGSLDFALTPYMPFTIRCQAFYKIPFHGKYLLEFRRANGKIIELKYNHQFDFMSERE